MERAYKIGTAADARAMRGGEHQANPLHSYQTAELGVMEEGALSSQGLPGLHARIERMRPSLASPPSTGEFARGAATAAAPVQRPDGDVELSARLSEHFRVPPCDSCGGVLKPAVVFFGDSLPAERKETASRLVRESAGLLVIGSSVQVFSAYRLVQQAREEGKSVGILTVGETRADGIASFKVESVAGEALSRIVQDPRMLVPPVSI